MQGLFGPGKDTQARNARYHDILDASNSGVFEWDISRREIFLNRRVITTLQIEAEPGWVPDSILMEVFPEYERNRLMNLYGKLDGDDETRRVEAVCLDRKGEKIFVQISGRVVTDEYGNTEKILGLIHDVSQQKKREERLRHEALHDYLTGLPNRTLLVDRIQHILTRLKRNSDLNATLLFIDIDNFKTINNNMGQGFGDDVLVSLGERLTNIVRAADTVSRLGSDEFVILLEDPTTSDIAHMLATRLLEKLQRPLRVQNKIVNLTFSVGLVLIDDPDASVEIVLGDADIAMYAAKDKGKGMVVPFDTTMRKQAAKRLDIETALRQAIDNEELYLVYQPIFSIDGCDEPDAIGVEALLRWTKSTRGNIAPGELLAVAEENGLIEDIGLWVITTACKQLARWQKEGFPADFYININLSSRHFDDDAIVEYMTREIDRYGVPRNGIRIEIVESAVIRNPENALSVIERLKDEGIFVSIDDFGTGFSSLSYLHRFPFYALKIDRSFIIDVLESEASQNIITAIILMAKKLGIRVVAEGIEESDQLQFLKTAGCEMVQGYLLARPETTPEVDRFFVDAEWVEARLAGS